MSREIAGVSEDAIHNHEDFAKFALAGVCITALMSLFALFRYQGLAFLRRRVSSPDRLIEGDVESGPASHFPAWVATSVLVLAMISAGLVGYTGKLGGMIRHTEFYGNTPAAEEAGEEGEAKENDKISKPETANPEEEKSGKNRRGRDKTK